MELSERERRTLADIEQHLSATDPRFAELMRGASVHGAEWTPAGPNTVIVVAGLSAFLCLALSLIWPTVVAALLAAVAFFVRPDVARHLPARAE